MAAMWTEIYQEHFQKYFAKPFDIQVYHDPDGVALKVATHDRARRGFRVLASMGLADKLVRNEEADFGEVILYADVPDKEIPRLFVNALFFILGNDIPLATPFSIGIETMQPAFAKRLGKTALYFTRPADDDEAFTEVHRGETMGRVFQAFFITPEEDAFLESHGPEAFEPEFRKQFGGKLTDEERCTLLVDKKRSQELDARLQELWRQFNTALSLRRPSCV